MQNEIETLRARIAELEDQMAAIGAGGVEPLRKAAPRIPAPDYDHWTGFMATCAVRYCLGRASYAPSVAMDWCKDNWHMLSAKDHHNIVRDVVGWLADLHSWDTPGTIPMEDYRKSWADFAHWCCERNGPEFAAKAVSAALHSPEMRDAPEAQSFLKFLKYL